MTNSFFEICSKNHITFYISQYPVLKNYEKICDKLKKYRISFTGSGEINLFLNYCLDQDGKQNPVESYKKCEYGGYCIQLKDNKLFSCFQSAHIEHINNFFGISFKYENGDFIDITKPVSKREFKKFITKPVPFCRYCNMDKLCETKWDISKKQKEEWIIE